MLSQASTSLCFFVFASSVSALALNNVPAEATALAGIFPNLAFPAPTPAPENHELRRRQEAQRTLLPGPDATCGYFGGNATQPWGCTASSTCAFATRTIQALDSTTTTAPGSVLCCDSAAGCPTAPGPTSCVDKGRFDIKTACTGSCLEDERVLKCTSGIYIFCNTISFPTPSLSAFFCNYISAYTPIPALTTFSGQGGREFTPTVQALTLPTSSSSSSSVSSSTLLPSSSILGGSSAGVVSSTASTAAADGGRSKKGVDKGAVIGGVVGGVAGLVLLVSGMIFVLRRRRGAKEAGKGGAGEDGSEDVVKGDVDVVPAKESGVGASANWNGKSEAKVPVMVETKVEAK